MTEEEKYLEIKKRRMDIVADFTTARYQVLTLVSSVLVGLLAISFSNEQDLIVNPLMFKISLSILVLLIPVSLLFFLGSFRYEETDMINKFERILKIKDDSEIHPPFFGKLFVLYSPWWITCFLFLGLLGVCLSFFLEDIPFICI